MLDLLIMLVALVCAPAMVYEIWAAPRRRRGEGVPQLGVIAAGAWAVIAPAVEVVGYLLKRAIAHQWRPTEEEKPALFRATLTAAYVYEGAESEDERGVVGAVAPLAKNGANVIATPQNDNNDAVVIAALARLVAAGKVGQTDAIKVGLGVAPSSTSVRYAEVRNAMRAEVERLKGAEGAQFNLTPEQVEWRKKMGLEDAA